MKTHTPKQEKDTAEHSHLTMTVKFTHREAQEEIKKKRKIKKKVRNTELDLESRRSSEETVKEEQEKEVIPGEARKPVGGNVSESSRKSSEYARCLPAGVSNGRSPTRENITKTDQVRVVGNGETTPLTPSREVVKINRPLPFKADGKSYLRCSPLSTEIRLGDGTTVKSLLDVCSNTGIINRTTFQAHYPTATLNSLTNRINGVGSQETIGWAVVPISIDCLNESRIPVTIQFDIEVYVVENFSVPMLVGLDAILDYGIEISTTRMEGFIPHVGKKYYFQLFAPSSIKYRPCSVRSSKRVIIPGRVAQAVKVKSPSMAEGVDYVFTPSLTVPRSIPASPQLTYCLMEASTEYIMFTNYSDHPIELSKGQLLGEAIAIKFGTQCIDNLDMEIDWSDLIRQGTDSRRREQEEGIAPPKTFVATASNGVKQNEDMLSFDAFGQERTRHPKSISEEEVQRIARNAPARTKGDLFPAEDDEEQTPIPPIPEGVKFFGINVDASLSEEKKKEIKNLVDHFHMCFSPGDTIGLVRTTRATIDLKGPLPPAQPNRPVGPAKRIVIDDTIDQLLHWDVIERSTSPTASPIVLIWQNGKWRFCVDFRALNAVTKGDAYPMLRSDYVFAALADKKYFSLLDAIRGYHQLEIEEVDRHKTAFISHRGLYQFKRLPFGLKNAPAQFQRMMDSVIGTLRWTAALVYIDDVLVYSDTWEEHIAHLRILLEASRKAGLKFSLEKCRFGFNELKVLGHGLSRYGLSTLEEKIKSIVDLSVPNTMGELHRLVGMFGYYRNFIRNFSKIALPLNELKRHQTRKEEGKLGNAPHKYSSKSPIEWNDEAQQAFDELKQRLSTAPILAHPKFDGRPFILYTDASKDAFGAVLCQLWTAEDYTEPFTKTESDESELKTFFSIQSKSTWKEDYLADPVFRKIYMKLQAQEADADKYDERFSIQEDGSMCYDGIRGQRVCLPLNRVRETLRISHDVLGHYGVEKTYDRIANTYYRPGLSSAVTAYVRHCPNCIKNKTTKRRTEGSLMPIDVPSDGSRTPRAFESINMDLIVGLPKSNGYDAILTVVDRFTKTGMFIPTTSNFTAASIANIILERIVSRGFLPLKFITDRDPRLIQSFWQTLCARLKIDHRKTAAFHAQTDGAAERLNQTLEMALRSYVAPRQNDWSKHLYLMELAYNTAKSSTTGFTPYELLYAQPQNPVERMLSSHLPDLDDVNENYAASDLLEETAVRIKDAQQAIVKATESYKRHYDGRHNPVQGYKVGDYASIKLGQHPVSIVKLNKLSQQKLPPYRIKRMVAGNLAVELDLPPSINIHPIVSIQHLEKAPNPASDPFGRTPNPEQMRSTKTTEPTQEVATIVDHRFTKGGKKKWRIRWRGQDVTSDEWVAEKKVEDHRMIQDYEKSIEEHQVHMAETFLNKSPLRKMTSEFPTVIPKEGHPIERPILYISRVTKGYEKQYEATELELSCANWAITRLRHYLEGSKLTLISDHQPLGEVLNSSPGTQYSLRIDKWRMLLMPFLDNLTILYKPGKAMTNVDPLSRARYQEPSQAAPPLVETREFLEGGKATSSEDKK